MKIKKDETELAAASVLFLLSEFSNDLITITYLIFDLLFNIVLGFVKM